MLRKTILCSARVRYSTRPRSFGSQAPDWKTDYDISAEHSGIIGLPINEGKIRHELERFAMEPRDRRRITNLPGREWSNELPADPIARLFFQRKDEHDIWRGSYVTPKDGDPDRIELAQRFDKTNRMYKKSMEDEVYNFCHRIREAGDKKKRFVVVPSTHDTRGIAQIMLRHGQIAGMRDFGNDKQFVLELKYHQNEHVISTIQPGYNDTVKEYEWSPKTIRRMLNGFGVRNFIRVFVVRTWDNHVIDHLEAARRNVGGRGLCVII